MPASRRDELIQAALRVFYRDGFRATGIDALLKEAGISKMTLYHHFRSKDELALAVLRREDEQERNALIREVERRAKSPRERLLAVFDALTDWVLHPDFHGCMFIHAAVEFRDPDSPVRRTAVAHKEFLHAYLRALVQEAGYTDADELALRLLVLIDGAVVLAYVVGASDSCRLHAARAMASAKGAAAELLCTAKRVVVTG